MNDDERRRLTAQVLHILDQSFRAYIRGDRAESRRLMDEANELDAFCVSGVVGGIRIGEIPNPEHDPQAWEDYLEAQRSAGEP